MRHFLFILIALLVSLPHASYAQNTNQVAVNIYADHKITTIGNKVQLLIEQDIAPEWHTYWTNPGDSGEPMTVKWDLPDNVMPSPLQSPTPKRIPIKPLVNFGYDGKASFLTSITIPTPYTGDFFPVRADVTWLVCKEICIPETAQLALDIPIGIENIPDNTGRFTKAINALPKSVDWLTNATYQNNNLNITTQTKGDFNFKNAEFFPDDWGLINNAANQTVRVDGHFVTISIPRDKKILTTNDQFTGILRFGTPAQGVHITATINDPPPLEIPKSSITLLTAIIFALIGGLILNIMPCVFPILSMKALHLAQITQHKDEASKARLHGLIYAAGVVISFLAIGLALITLKAGGAQIGWGFQLQTPAVLVFLFYLMVAIGLYFSGLFEIGYRMAGLGSTLAGKTGISGSFFTGVLAVIVAAPCTAPFMASALGYALTHDTLHAFSIFGALGVGMALPFLMISVTPSLHKIMPKPGPWMVTFRQFLAFPMFLTALWLLWVYTQQTDIANIIMVLLGAMLIAFALWLGGRLSATRKLLRIISVLIISISIYLAFTLPFSSNAKIALQWQAYSLQTLERALRDNPARPVFVNMTADWCITCKVNEAITFNNNAVIQALQNSNTILIEGDWTNHDAEIAAYLAEFDRAGVPLYVYYPAGDVNRLNPSILPQILTPQIIINHLKGSSQ